MRYAIIWTWIEPRHDNVPANPHDESSFVVREKISYFCTLSEAMAAFDEPAFGEKDLVVILESRGRAERAKSTRS